MEIFKPTIDHVESTNNTNKEFLDNSMESNLNGTINIIKNPENGSGSIQYYKQLHSRPEMSEEELNLVGKAQYKILQDLLQRGPKNIFLESFHDNTSSKKDYNKMLVDAVNMAFQNIGNTPNQLQKEILQDLGAGQVYFLISEGVKIHKTISKEESDQIDQLIHLDGKIDHNDFNLILDKREELTMKYINRFMLQNKGEDIALIYGAAHDFSQYTNDNGLTEISYPNIMRQYIELKERATEAELDGLIESIDEDSSRNNENIDIAHKNKVFILTPEEVDGNELLQSSSFVNGNELHLSSSFINGGNKNNTGDIITIKESDISMLNIKNLNKHTRFIIKSTKQ